MVLQDSLLAQHSLAHLLSSSQGLLSCLFAETHRMVFLAAPLPPLICPDPCSRLEREKHPRPVGRPAVYAAAGWMQQACTQGRLAGSRLALCVCGDAEKRREENSTRPSFVSRAEENRTEPWEGARGKGVSRSRVRILGFWPAKSTCTYMRMRQWLLPVINGSWACSIFCATI